MSKARILGMPSRPVRDRVRRKNPFRKNGKRGKKPASRNDDIS